MPNAVESYYTTDEPHRPQINSVASNHLSKIEYETSSLTLTITFANGAKYQYFGIPKNLYEGLMRSPSHGVFFWQNIRQRFPYRQVDNLDGTASSICPELKKLDKLDNEEQALRSKFNKGLVPETQYNQLMNVIKTKRERLCKKLERDGYYSTEEMQDDYQEQVSTITTPLEQAKPSVVGLLFKGFGFALGMIFKTIFLSFGVFFGLLAALK